MKHLVLTALVAANPLAALAEAHMGQSATAEIIGRDGADHGTVTPRGHPVGYRARDPCAGRRSGGGTRGPYP